MSKFATRRSPSGPAVGLQLPYYNATPNSAAGTHYAQLISGTAGGSEDGTEYRIPAFGRLDTLQVSNQPTGPDAVNVTYRVRKNTGSGAIDVGPPVIIGNNAQGPVRANLTSIDVRPGDLISLSVSSPGFGGAPPMARILFTWVPAGSA